MNSFGKWVALTLLVLGSALAFSAEMPEVPVRAESWETLHSLQDGNGRFSSGRIAHPHAKPQRRTQIAHEQRPKAVVLSCSDSRVPPELIFDQGLGDLFTVRTAGHVLGAGTVASIEYAISQLNSNLIIVMGHESCGAVKAALAAPPQNSSPLESGTPLSYDLEKLLSKIRPNIKDFVGQKVEATLQGPVRANVEGTIKQLLERSDLIRIAVKEGRLMIVPAIYHLSGGHVEFWQVGKKKQKPLLQFRKK
ncbi:MAG: carbonic anhydrase [Bdellovibrio sp.]|nr:carbonic anhydrase [Bdellovibrio sp.]